MPSTALQPGPFSSKNWRIHSTQSFLVFIASNMAIPPVLPIMQRYMARLYSGRIAVSTEAASFGGESAAGIAARPVEVYIDTRSEEGSLRDNIPQAGLESLPAAACGGNRQAEIGNRKERRWRDYTSFPGRQPNVPSHSETQINIRYQYSQRRNQPCSQSTYPVSARPASSATWT